MPRSHGELSPLPFRPYSSFGTFIEYDDGAFVEDEVEEGMSMHEDFTDDDSVSGSNTIRNVLELDDDDNNNNNDYNDEAMQFERKPSIMEELERHIKKYGGYRRTFSSSSPIFSSSSSSSSTSPPTHRSPSPLLNESLIARYSTQLRSSPFPDSSYFSSSLVFPPLPSSSTSFSSCLESSFSSDSNSTSERSFSPDSLACYSPPSSFSSSSNSSFLQCPLPVPALRLPRLIPSSSTSNQRISPSISVSNPTLLTSSSSSSSFSSSSKGTTEFPPLSSTPASFSQLNEVFSCFICFGTLTRAVMCPQCSKLGCYECLQKWMTDQHSTCPHCRASLRLSEFIPCRFIEDLKHSMNDLLASQHSQLHSFGNDLCSTHHKALYYYCEVCDEPICPDCAMFESHHQGHSFVHLDKLYKSKVTQLQEERENVVSRVSLLKRMMKKANEEIQKLHTAKCMAESEIQKTLETVKRQLEMALKKKYEAIVASKSSIEQQLDQLNKVYDSLHHAILAYPPSKLVKESNQLLHHPLPPCPTSPSSFDSTSFRFQLETQLPDFVGSPIITIPQLSKFSNGDPFLSDILWVSGAPWRLKVYPFGNSKSASHVSMFLEKVILPTATKETLYTVSFCLLSLSSESKRMEFSTSFSYNKAMGSSHAFPLISPITLSSSSSSSTPSSSSSSSVSVSASVSASSSSSSPSSSSSSSSNIPLDSNLDSLKLQFFVRPQTYLQKTSDLESYVQWLQSPTPLPQVHPDLEEIEVVLGT